MTAGGLDPGRARQAIVAWQESIDAALRDQSELLAGQPLPGPPANLNQEQLAGWWEREVSAADKQRYLTERPDLIAGLDGLPAAVRDQANRTLLEREQADLRARIATERAEADAAVGPGGDAERLTSTRAADELQRKLDGLDALSGRIGARPTGDAGYFLLDYNSGGDGRAVVALHNPDTAANVATFIPGADTDLRSLPGTIDRIDALHQAAGRAQSPSTSVIAWLDYDSPPGYDVGGNNYASDAAKDLDNFQHGLRASHDGEVPSHNTVVGHSYGSLVAGIAARQENLPIDDFVSVGGVGVGANHARDLNLPLDGVWATEATADNLADVGRGLGGFRTDPAGAAFEAQVFESDTPVPLPIDPHSQYFYNHPENTGLNNIGIIIANGTPSPAR